ncbi:TPA: O-unit flippase-like protein [Citrobacter freundii]
MLRVFIKNIQLMVGLINQSCNIIVPFIITFASLKILPQEQGSIWLMFLSMVILVNLFDFGLSPTILRNVSYVTAGAQHLSKDALDEIKFSDTISFSLLGRLIVDIKIIYKKLTFLAVLVITICGGCYFFFVTPKDILSETMVSWLIFSTGLLLSLYYLYYTPILSGFGEIHYANLSNIYGRLSWLVFSLLCIPIGLTLINLSLSFLLSIIVARMSSAYFYNRNRYAKEIKKTKPAYKSTIPYISGSAIKLGLATVGNVAINRAPIIIAGIAFSLNIAGAFTLTMQIFLAIISVSNVYLAVKIPILSQLIIKNEKVEVKKMVMKIIVVSVALYLLGVIIFVFSSDMIISLTGSKVGFLETKYILLLGVILLLDLNHNICASILTAGNKIPFVIPVIISGALISISGWLFADVFNMGVIGLIAAQGIVQLSYNNWRWPVMVYSEYIRK